MESRGGGRKKIGGQIVLTCIILAAIWFCFYDFAQENHRRVVEQNERYIEELTNQAADRVDDMMQARQSSLRVIAVTVENLLTEPRVSQETLQMLQEKSSFDYIEFVDAAGCNYRADGQVSDSSDRENYLQGMQGNTGVTLIFNSRITHETLVNYYTPISYQGEIVGVLNGMYREESLRETISTSFFDHPGRTYLCMRDGTVISSHGGGDDWQNVLEFIADDSAGVSVGTGTKSEAKRS